MKRKQRCEQQEKTSIRSSKETHLYWKKTFLYGSIMQILKLTVKLIVLI